MKELEVLNESFAVTQHRGLGNGKLWRFLTYTVKVRKHRKHSASEISQDMLKLQSLSQRYLNIPIM